MFKKLTLATAFVFAAATANATPVTLNATDFAGGTFNAGGISGTTSDAGGTLTFFFNQVVNFLGFTLASPASDLIVQADAAVSSFFPFVAANTPVAIEALGVQTVAFSEQPIFTAFSLPSQQPTSPAVASISVELAAVPVPASMPLLAGALGLAGFAARRKAKRA